MIEEAAGLDIPEGWWSRASSSNRARAVFAVVICQVVAVAIIFRLEPAGFDRCEAVPSDAAQAVQKLTASAAFIISLLVALFALKGWARALCLMLTVLAGMTWLLLLISSQNC